MKTYKIEIKGISPLIFNIRQREIDLEKKGLRGDELDEWDEKNWRRKAALGTKGEVRIPARWLRKSIINAATFSRIVPYFAKSKKETYTRYLESIFVESDDVICSAKELKPYGDYTNKGTQQRPRKIWEVRPMLEKWNCRFILHDMFGRMRIEELKQILAFAGAYVGIGDNRKNNFGRFEVVKIMEVENDKD